MIFSLYDKKSDNIKDQKSKLDKREKIAKTIVFRLLSNNPPKNYILLNSSFEMSEVFSLVLISEKDHYY